MFGKRLAELRNNKGISQYELAARMKLSRGQLANYEQGTREPDFNTLIALADFFEVSLDSFLGRNCTTNEVNEEPANVAYFGGTKENLTEEESNFLKESLQLLRTYELRLKESKS
ncbi:helix-turn-helix domain-containing protein [Paenibacillus alginolyticus]|uniref:Helix-turn-helix domain-containing protein n=1 Tax=Paenibacillus alginolyticus TaxID=59839 RepID=A0ABT4GA17_9BACL|nr:helix-turn-helix domain-containing protein [Paenibacillus alginolyticus]MEC0146133.1 helix-turn-helix transcriptional regulator [Paenibacillus alginolyticus]